MHVLCSLLQLLPRGSGTRYEVDLLLDGQQAVQIVEHAARNRPDRAVGDSKEKRESGYMKHALMADFIAGTRILRVASTAS